MRESYHIPIARIPGDAEREALAVRVFERVFRTDFERPGFALLTLEADISSQELRRFMAALKQELGICYHHATGRHLAYRLMGRFDQQTTTKFHLDGAPDESYLMLGYEPSAVKSEVWTADYSRAAYDLGISPIQYLIDYNPMFSHGERQLVPYRTQLTAFQSQVAQILLVNNSRLSYNESEQGFQGVMHKATILMPQPEQTRIINSTMLISVANASEEPVSRRDQEMFVQSDAVSGPLV